MRARLKVKRIPVATTVGECFGLQAGLGSCWATRDQFEDILGLDLWPAGSFSIWSVTAAPCGAGKGSFLRPPTARRPGCGVEPRTRRRFPAPRLPPPPTPGRGLCVCFRKSSGPRRKVEDVGNKALNWELSEGRRCDPNSSAHLNHGERWGFHERNCPFSKRSLAVSVFFTDAP